MFDCIIRLMIVFVLVLLTKRTVVLCGRFVALSSAKRQSCASAHRRICTCSEAYKSGGFFIFASLFAIFYILLKQRTPAYFATAITSYLVRYESYICAITTVAVLYCIYILKTIKPTIIYFCYLDNIRLRSSGMPEGQRRGSAVGSPGR